MKQVKIDEDLFLMLCRYHLLDVEFDPDLSFDIRTRLTCKLASLSTNLEKQRLYLSGRRSGSDSLEV